MSDRNFDDIAEKFSRNIYDTAKGQIRQAILWQDLASAFECSNEKPLLVLDAGGGNGIMSCRMAELGHKVIFCDISEQMLLTARENARQRGVEDSITFIHASAQDVGQYLDGPVDLVLFHAVLEWVKEPQQVLQVLNSYLVTDGILSLMFYNYNGLLFRNIQLGNFGYINAGMYKKKRKTLSPDNPLRPEQVYAWLAEMNMSILVKSGVRVFNDYLRDKLKDFDTLLKLEQHYCRQEPFLSLGRYIHVMAQKSDITTSVKRNGYE